MPIYCFFVDRRKVPGIDEMNFEFSGPCSVFNRLKKYQSEFKVFSSSGFGSDEYKKLEKDTNYRKIFVAGN